MNDERIRRVQSRAHAIWEEQGRPHGRHEDHWRQAEQELGENAAAPGQDPVPPDAPMAQPGAAGTGGMGSDAGMGASGSAGGGASATGGAMGSDVANAGAAAPAGARALRGGPQQGAMDTGGSDLGSRSDLD